MFKQTTMSGQCNVEVNSIKVSELKELDVFGEAALVIAKRKAIWKY